MIRILVTILIALPLLSVAPIPATLPNATIVRHSAQTIVVPRVQECTWETAPARLAQQIEDPIGYPFGQVLAWSCDGDSAAVVAELSLRAAAMQEAAAAYRAAHPVAGVK